MSDPDRTRAAARPPVEGVGYAVTVLTAINLFNYLDRYVLPVLLPSIERDLHFGHGRSGILGSAFVVVYMAVSPVFGRLGDRGPRRVLIALGIALWSLASAAGGIVHGFTTLLVARACVGVGEAAYATISPALISDYAPPERRGRIMAIFFAAIPLGSALGFILGSAVSARFGWRYAFFITGLPGLALAALALRMKEPVRGAYDTPGEHVAPPIAAALHTLRSSREYVWAVAGYTATTFGLGGLSFWMPTYLHEVRHVAEQRAGITVGALTVVAGLLGTLVGGWLGERARKRIAGGYFAVCGYSTIAAAVCAIAMFSVASLSLSFVLLFASVFCVFIPNGPVNTILVNSVPAEVRATAAAVCIFCIHFFGDAGSPALIGYVSDVTSLRRAVLLVPLTIGLGGCLWLVGQRRARV